MNEIPVPECEGECSMCGKPFEKERLVARDGDLCHECRKTYKDMAFIYCRKCGKIVTRVKPGITDTGLMVNPGDVLHVKECPICSPGILVSIPEEMQTHEKVR